MQRLDTMSAANAIRDDLQQPAPEDRHAEAFVKDVLDHLGLEHSLANTMMVAQALYRHDIQPHLAQEYPKWVQPDHLSEPVLVHSDIEEAEAMQPPPAPVDEPDEDVTRQDAAEEVESTNEPAADVDEPGEDVTRVDDPKPPKPPTAPARAPIRGRAPA